MNEQLIKTVNERFSHLSGKPVVIYGMGQFAAELAGNRDSLVFNITGVMDRDVKAGFFMGIPVVDTDTVQNFADIIIIAALGSSCPIIYERIKFLKDLGVDIYFPDGEKRSARTEIYASEYFIKTRSALTTKIDGSDVISFDIFDTLIFRKCLYPKEVFRILQDRCEIDGFAEKRVSAETSAKERLGRHPTIFDIYEHMGLENPSAHDEIALERDMLTVRGDMFFFYNYAIGQRKTVILTSDMYLPEPVLRELLTFCGITEYARLYVSCDLNETKREGGIWNCVLSDYPGKRILHIGDNNVSDNVERGNLTSHIIKSTVEIADLLGFGEALTSAGDYRSYCAIGVSLARLLTLDMTCTDRDGRIVIDSAEDIGYAFIAPQTLGFVKWLAETAAKNKETSLCFCARDTYMFMKLYEKLRRRYNAPPAKYLYVSKRVLCGTLCDNIKNIRECLDYYYARFDAKTTVKTAVYRLFGVMLPDDSFAVRAVKEIGAAELAAEIEKTYMGVFRENAVRERLNFETYLKKQGIDPKNAAIADYICGKSVRLGHKIFGGRFYLYGLSDAGLSGDDTIYAWLEKTETSQLPYYHILKQSQFGEAVYGSPEGSCLAFDENGRPVLDDEQIDFSVNDAIYKGVEKYCEDMPHIADCETADKIFGTLFTGNYNCGQALNGLTWSSYTANKGGIPV